VVYVKRVFKAKDRWDISRKAVRYIRNSEEFLQVLGDEDEQWWHDFAAKWPETTIIEFIDLHYTPEQLTRLEEIQNVDGQYAEEIERYVLEGTIPDIPFFMPKPEEIQAQILLNTEFLVVLAEIQHL
jgi:hypothetical protein